MCGIVGGVTQRPISKILIEGLRRLEYRGYDSAGISLLNTEKNTIDTTKMLGKVQQLDDVLNHTSLSGHLGIAHTRWATHGAPAQHNAHPHNSHQSLSIVHNGIIENYSQLRSSLITNGYNFESETDSEVIVHLLHQQLQSESDTGKALWQVCQQLQGAYAIVLIDKNAPDTLYATRYGSPLVIGCGFDENFLASDPLALLPVTQTFIYLQEGDLVRLTKDAIDIFDHEFNPANRDKKATSLTIGQAEKGQHRHYMQKEIYEQPQVVADTLNSALDNKQVDINAFGHQAEQLFSQIQRIHIIACGTSLHAAAVAQHWIERYARLPCQIEIASEHRYRQRALEPNTLFLALSQSGETADTLAALRQAKTNGYLASMGICNVPESSLMREADLTFLTRAGTEIGVAATKTFTAQLIALAMFTLALAKAQQTDIPNLNEILYALHELPKYVQDSLNLDLAMAELATHFIDNEHALFLGRGEHYAIAMEGALKLKEISYIHAEAYASGELKHGPLALIDDEMPVVVIAPNNELIDKVISNINEVQARGGQLYIFSDKNITTDEQDNITVITMPTLLDFISPIVYNIPLQLLAYHVAVLKGTDVDQPRNLAKSVTVE